MKHIFLQTKKENSLKRKSTKIHLTVLPDMDQKLDGTDFSQYFRDIKAESDTSLLLKQAHLSIFCEVKD